MNEYDELLTSGVNAKPRNEYDAVLQEQKGAQTTLLRATMQTAAQVTPDRAAQVIKLSERTKLPTNVVERNFDDLSKKYDLSDNEYDSMLRENPKLSKWLLDTSNASIARDDLPLMRRIENTFTSFGRGWSKASIQGELADLLYKEMESGISPVEKARRDKLKGDIKYLTEQDAANGVPEYTAGVTGYSARQMGTTLYEGAKGVATGGAVGAAAGSVLPGVGNVAGGTAGMIAGGATTLSMYAYKMEAAFAYDELRDMVDINDNKIDPKIARNVARGVGVVNALIEAGSDVALSSLVPGFGNVIGGLSKQAAKKAVQRQALEAMKVPTTRGALASAAGKMGGAGATEGTEEFLQSLVGAGGREIAQSASGQTFKPDDITDDIRKASGEALDAAVGTFFTFAPVGGARFYQLHRQAQKAQEQEQFFLALGQGVSESKVYERLPPKMQDFIAQTTKDGPVDKVYVPVEQWSTYWQNKGIDPAAAAEAVVGNTTMYESAIQSGADLVIPMDRFATRIAPTEHGAFFASEARLAPDEMNAREAKELEATLAKEQQKADAESQAAAASKVQAQDTDAVMTKLREEIKQKLIAAGVEQRTADDYASAQEARFRQFADRAGISAEALFERFVKGDKLQVGSGETQGAGQQMMSQRARLTAVPSAGSRDDGQLQNLELRNAQGRVGEAQIHRTTYGDTPAWSIAFMGLDKEHQMRGLGLHAVDAVIEQIRTIDPEATHVTAEVMSQNIARLMIHRLGQPEMVSDDIRAYTVDEALEMLPKLTPVEKDGISPAAGNRIFMAWPMPEQLDQSAVEETINVDGQDRPVMNSKGVLIADTPKAMQNFWRWFGDSKVVDEKGRPLVVYHGSIWPGLEEFDADMAVEVEDGIFFSTNEDVAHQYTFERAYGDIIGEEPLGEVHSVYLKIDSMLDYPAKGRIVDAIEMKRAIDQAKAEKDDGIIVRNIDDSIGMTGDIGDTYIVFEPNQVKSAEGNTGSFDPMTGSILHQSLPNVENDLIIQHNITAEKLLKAVKIGGFPVPSLAVTKASNANTNYGEVTLIGPREMADPRGYANTRVFGGDIYSPRYPNVEYKFTDASLKPLGKIIAKHAALTGSRHFDMEELQKKGADYISSHPAVMAEALERRGELKNIKRPAGDKEWEVNEAVRRQLRDAVVYGSEARAEADKIGVDLMQQMAPSERIFRGFTNNGNRSYQPHTIENVVRILKKDLRGGESAGNIYGIGQLRAMFTPQFKSLKGIKDSKDLIVDHETFEKVKKEIETEFFAIVDDMKPYYNHDANTFRFSDTVMAVIEESPRGLDRALRQYDFDADLPVKVREDIFEFVTRLRNLPTEYFEAKVMRDVSLSEFRAAVVPTGVGDDVMQALFAAGITNVGTYTRGDMDHRRSEIKRISGDLGASVLFQPPEQDAKRGSITFTSPGDNRRFRIDLLEGADLSTFVHESGHFWLEVMGDLVQELRTGEASKLNDKQRKMVEDYDALLKWMGVSSRADIGVEQHEQFARGIEAYFMEGKAPSQSLQNLFARVRSWMLAIYQSLSKLNVALTPEVREVFDRMLASDQEIETAQAEAGIVPLFADDKTLLAAGFTTEFVFAYRNKVQAASDSAKRELQEKVMRAITREREKWWKDERAVVRADVAAEVNARQDQIALSVLTRDVMPNGDPLPYDMQRVKLNRAEVDAMYGDGSWKTLPRGSTATDGLPLQAVADLFGYGSGDALVKAVRQAKPANAVIEAETDSRMKAEHGDMLVDGTIHAAAQEAVQNEERMAVIQAELRALAKLRAAAAPAVALERRQAREGRSAGLQQVRAAVPPIAAVRQMAAGRIALTRVSDLTPNTYLVAARRASQAAIEAATKGDYDVALSAKQREMMNIELFKASTAAREEVDKTVDYMQSFGESKKRARMAKAGQDYLDQIDGFLDRYDFAHVSGKALERRKNLAAWVAQKEAAGEPVNLPDDVILETRTNYKDMTVEELRGVRDSVKHIEHMAKLKNRLLTAQKNRDLAEVVAEIETSIRANATKVKGKQIESRLPTDEALRFVDTWFGMHRKLSNMVRQMDGWKDGGALWEYVMRPINDAANREASMNADGTRKLQKLFDAYQGKEGAELYVKREVPEIGGSLTKMARLMVALNWGNNDNRQKIMDSYGWTPIQIESILNTLDARDWKFVQGVWDFVDSYWPDIAAKEKRVNGIAPAKVERSPVMTKFGEFEGGYFPLRYDDRQDAAAHGDRIKEAAEQMMRGGYTSQTTRRGHTKERVEGVNRPIRLDFGVIFEHVTQVVHDLSHHEMLIDVTRLLRSKPVSSSVIEVYGDVTYKQLQNTLTDIAAGDIPAVGAFEKYINYLRQGVTISGLGWNLMTSLLQPLGIAQSMVRIGPKWVGQGMRRWLSSGNGMEGSAAWIQDRSEFMRNRFRTQQREINEIRNQVGVQSGKLTGWIDQAMRTTSFNTITKQGVVDSYFWMIAKAQQVADIPTWLGAYEKAMADPVMLNEDGTINEKRVVDAADQAVLDSQGGGQIKDMAAIQRGGPLLKIWTSFYSYFNVTYNMSRESIGRTKFSNPISVGRLAVDYLLLYTVPATMGALMKAALKGDTDDDEKLVEKLIRENLSYMFGVMVGLREVGSVIQGYAGYEGPTGARFFATIGKLIKQVEQQEADAAFWRALNDAAGILFHYPAGQVRRTVEGVDALNEGDTKNPAAVLFGAPKQ